MIERKYINSLNLKLESILQLSATARKGFDLWTEWLIKEVEKR